jgi:hypothetical protein
MTQDEMRAALDERTAAGVSDCEVQILPPFMQIADAQPDANGQYDADMIEPDGWATLENVR